MLAKHAHTVAMINRDRPVAYLLRDYFGLRRGASMMPALLERGLGQADLVLALLRCRDRHRGALLWNCYVELLVGHPIVVGPRCLLRYNEKTSHPRVVRCHDDRRILSAVPDNPRQPNTAGHAAWSEYRVGRTLGQLYVRGVSRREVRRAIANQWIAVEAVQREDAVAGEDDA